VICQDGGCLIHNQYDRGASNTSHELDLDLNVQFGTGELSGVINTDTVYLGGVAIDSQDFAEIQKETGNIFMEAKFDGIVGLGYPEMAAYQFRPIFDNIIAQNKLKRNVFSFYFDARDGSRASRMILGGVDQNLIEEPLRYFPVVDPYYWTIEAKNILVNGNDLGLCVGGCRIVADTGTSLFTGPSAEVEALLQYLDVKSDCGGSEFLPDITFVLPNGRREGQFNSTTVTEVRLTLKPEDYLMKLFNFAMLRQECGLAIMPLDVPMPHGPLWILGDIFLSKYYSVFDRDHDMVGFALAKKESDM